MGRRRTPVILTTTAPDEEKARQMGRALVERRLAACVQLIDPIRSIYRWNGAVQEETEVLLVVKTTAERVRDIQKLLDELHPYEVPELVASPIVDGSPAYLDWILDSVD